MKNNKDLTMIKMPDGKIVNKKSNEINSKPDSKENKNDVTPIH